MEQLEITLGIVNGSEIKVIQNEEKLVPIKPICEALGVASNKQIGKIKDDPILGLVETLGVSTGKDGKSYQMQCLPLKYVFGWLFRIDSRNVKEEAKETVIAYQMMCYDLLYDYFAGYADYVETKQQKIEKYLKMAEAARMNFRTAKDRLATIEKGLKEARGVTFEEYKAANGQYDIFESVDYGLETTECKDH
ncbi:phage antirepressor N-terminal domain-containing protein [Marinilongibacter aquaticus]|uniref:phage antirepressor N-terminal domain-containing protein n=1 Tax=Marinilongibacter aquaticus TaxID=2975157 RepID=UPI0021BDE961|nr:phage antirepressor N-terminal domain-containing protein [Marinilongibacter aquaticus]UBM58211.1 phage antirepressor N-terminal domain-containing protein [Marinilongibacter aquaticus]